MKTIEKIYKYLFHYMKHALKFKFSFFSKSCKPSTKEDNISEEKTLTAFGTYLYMLLKSGAFLLTEAFLILLLQHIKMGLTNR
jgi:hypothetical protein